MTDDNTNLDASASGSELTGDPTSLDNPENWNFYDPETDGEVEEVQEAATEDEKAVEEVENTDETDQSEQEQEKADPAEDSEEEQPEADKATPEPVTLQLPSGEAISQEEAVQGFMRNADYTRKTQAIAEKRKGVEAQAEQLQRTVDVLADFIGQALPPEPDANLAYTDPTTYNAQQAAYNQQLGQLDRLLKMAETPKEVAKNLTESEKHERLTAENAKLLSAFPQAATTEGRDQFFKDAFESGGSVGFTEQEMKSVEDHRILALAHYAKIGMQAEKAAKTAKAKVKAAPKASPKKQRAIPKNNDAMKRLAKSGSIADAMAVDFD